MGARSGQWQGLKGVAVALLLTGWAHGSFLAAERPGRAPELDTSQAVKIVHPDYPYEARRQRLAGTGIVTIDVDTATGNVTRVTMTESTGHAILDHATTKAFRQWRFKPGIVARAQAPITFSMDGRRPVFRERSKPAGDALAAFLGEGTVLRGSFPAYPKSVPWKPMKGSGVYEIHANPARLRRRDLRSGDATNAPKVAAA